jgi:uncharacterized protein DUF1553/uncharacterized protein DUF1549/cytochrome c
MRLICPLIAISMYGRSAGYTSLMVCTFATALLGNCLCAGNPAIADQIDFNRDIRPILSNYCFQCHGPDADERQGGTDGLRLDTEEGAFADIGGTTAIVRGKPAESLLIDRIASADPDEMMPPEETGNTLSADEIGLMTEWILQGAPYAGHWSYNALVRSALPEVENKTWPRNPIDFFLLSRLEHEGLSPSAEADPATLVRRLALDLTGLPPTLEEVDKFVDDPSDNAYEQLVESMLQKKSFGEHWARMWLDLARYADSAGYADDPPRTIWAYRDWVIRAFNKNQSFADFTIEQIAGDLLPEPTEDQLIATAFHRNTLTNNEGGTDDEEFRNVAVVDRVNTTMAVWMGTTVNCAQCHNHKYDPISQEDFFRLFAIFNNTEDADRTDDSPLLEIYSEPGIRPPAESEPITTVPIQRELSGDQRRQTRIQFRGNFLTTGKQVLPGVPIALHSFPRDMQADRLSLAHWLVDKDNPLTPRVIANRYWESIFGIGIVRTSEDFGAQGELPSHPELLDWLATELLRRNWDLKAMLKLLVTSAAYRQSSRTDPLQLERDPDNRLLARGPRFRLSAEMIRDQSLSVSGLLSPKMFGPPVHPPQPKLNVKAAFGSGIDWQTSLGEDRTRRSLYTSWRRSNPYPSMTTFDAPNREICTIRRVRTNTPLQALVTLNDPVFIEAAQALSRKMATHGNSPEDQIRYGFRVCLARNPERQEQARLVRLYQQLRTRYANDADKAQQLATQPIGAAPDQAQVAELAALTVVSNVLLNLDEMLMKP